MADPTITSLTAGSSSVATTTVSFSAQTAGTLLLLSYAGDDYHTTSGSGRPESSSWTQVPNCSQRGSGQFHGSALWYKFSTGSETSVQYTIGSASRSTYKLIALTDIDSGSPVDASNSQHANGSVSTYTTPSVSTTAGRRCAVAVIGGSHGASLLTAPGTWLNSYVSQGAGLSTSAPGLATAHATLTFDGGGSTSSGATFTGTTPEARSGHIVVFKVASGGGSQQAVTGTIAIASALTGGPTVLVVTSGTAPVVSAITGVPAARLGVAGTVSVTSAASGTTNTLGPASGSTPIVAAVSGAPTTLAVAAGTIPVVSTASGAANLGGSLAASGGIVVTTASSGAVTLRATAAGAIPVTSAAAGAANTLEPTSGSAIISSALIGAPTTLAVAAGSVPVVSSASGSVDVQPGGSLATSGTVTITTATTGTTSQRHAVTATVTVVSASAGTAGSRQIVTGTVAVVTAVSGAAGQRHAVTALVAIVSAASGAAGKTIPLAGVVVIVSTASGTPQEGGWVGPIVPRGLVGYLRSDGQYVGRLHHNGRYEAKVR
jgi:hypothetical protein